MESDKSRPPESSTPRPRRASRLRSSNRTVITPRPTSITGSRSSSPHPPSISPFSINDTGPCIPLAFDRAILRITAGRIDASTLSTCQIHYLALHEKSMYTSLDFTRCTDAFIHATIGNILSTSVHVPLKFRR